MGPTTSRMLRAAAILITLHCALAFPQAFNSTSNATFIATSCDEGDNCYDMRMQNVQGCTSGWGLHGLWPQWAETCTQEAVDKSQLSSIADQLNKNWPSCEGSAQSFWSHEWKKHGTCSGMSQLAYFSKALQLLAQYKSGCDSANDQSCNVCFDKSLSTKLQCNSR